MKYAQSQKVEKTNNINVVGSQYTNKGHKEDS